jgi:hypothetical protein
MQRHLHRTRWFNIPCHLVLKLNAICYPILANPVKAKLGFLTCQSECGLILP